MAPFAPGFRLSVSDIVVIVLSCVVASLLTSLVWWWGLVPGFVVAHFFLFCNVLRMSRPLELLWATVFLVLSGATIACGIPGWPITVVISLIVTAFVTVLEMRKPSYHGIGWTRINPGLPKWWASHVATRESS